MHSIIVNAVIRDGDKILLSQRSFEEKHEPGKWTIPGGKIEITEGDVFNIIEKTLKKEVKEEVDLEIEDNVQLIENNTFIRSDGTHVIAMTFLCKYKSGTAIPSEDTINVAWITEKEIDNYEFPPNVRGYVEKGFSLMVNR